MVEWESPDHSWLGDCITLQFGKGELKMAKNMPLELPNGLRLTYGEINALAGDFYGTWKPISDPTNAEERKRRFIAAWESLAKDTKRQPGEATGIIRIIKEQNAAVIKAIKDGKSPSDAYQEVYGDFMWDARFQKETQGRRDLQNPTYIDLAVLDWDHFGVDARLAYETGHAAAIEVAYLDQDLQKAYSMNAFADHFLQDSFSAGHVRTPRRALHSGALVDEDGKARVKSPCCFSNGFDRH